MAKTQTNTAGAETQTSAVGFAPIAVAATAGGDSRSIVLKVPMADGTTKEMKRVDYIRARWAQKADRGTIRKEVESLQGKPVPYQVIFAATKGQAGGPDKAAKAEAEETGTEE